MTSFWSFNWGGHANDPIKPSNASSNRTIDDRPNANHSAPASTSSSSPQMDNVNNPESVGTDTDETPPSPMPPAVSASQSGETTLLTLEDLHVDDGEDYDDDHHNHYHAPSHAAPGYILFKLFARSQWPDTPEGLRPRPSLDDLRQHLKLQQQQQAISASHGAASPADFPGTSRSTLLPATVLPPRPTAKADWLMSPTAMTTITTMPRSSVSQPSHHPHQDTLEYPKVSAERDHGDDYYEAYNIDHQDDDDDGLDHSHPSSGRYTYPTHSTWTSSSRTSPPYAHPHDGVAASPQLLPGQARTAVGALIASQACWWNQPPWAHPQQQQHQPRSQDLVSYPPVAYHNDSYGANHDSAPAPLSGQPSTSLLLPLPPPVQDHQWWDNHPHQPEMQYYHLANPSATIIPPDDFHAPVSTIAQGDRDQAGDDGTEIILAPHGQAGEPQAWGICSNHLVHDSQISSPPLDAALRRIKRQNQRRFREDLLLAALERLQDNVELAHEVIALDVSSVVSVPIGGSTSAQKQEDMLAGFSHDKRQALLLRLHQWVEELGVAAVRPEDLFFSSPSQCTEYAQPHNDLRQAFQFVCHALQMAVPAAEKGYEDAGTWKMSSHLQSALGLVPPESPEDGEVLRLHRRYGAGRGGDTSVFSLPTDSESTPMTSNVSLTTTLTSPTAGGGGNAADRTRSMAVHGLQIRRTLQILVNLWRRMSDACHGLSSSPNVSTASIVKATTEMKACYLAMLSMDLAELKLLVDAFGLTAPSPLPPPCPYMTLPLPPLPQSRPEPLQRSQPRVVSMNGDGAEGTDGDGIFSPHTADMRSWHGDFRGVGDDDGNDHRHHDACEDEDEDLRRQVGSADYDDADLECRDEPESDNIPVIVTRRMAITTRASLKRSME